MKQIKPETNEMDVLIQNDFSSSHEME